MTPLRPGTGSWPSRRSSLGHVDLMHLRQLGGDLEGLSRAGHGLRMRGAFSGATQVAILYRSSSLGCGSRYWGPMLGRLTACFRASGCRYKFGHRRRYRRRKQYPHMLVSRLQEPREWLITFNSKNPQPREQPEQVAAEQQYGAAGAAPRARPESGSRCGCSGGGRGGGRCTSQRERRGRCSCAGTDQTARTEPTSGSRPRSRGSRATGFRCREPSAWNLRRGLVHLHGVSPREPAGNVLG